MQRCVRPRAMCCACELRRRVILMARCSSSRMRIAPWGHIRAAAQRVCQSRWCALSRRGRRWRACDFVGGRKFLSHCLVNLIIIYLSPHRSTGLDLDWTEHRPARVTRSRSLRQLNLTSARRPPPNCTPPQHHRHDAHLTGTIPLGFQHAATFLRGSACRCVD